MKIAATTYRFKHYHVQDGQQATQPISRLNLLAKFDCRFIFPATRSRISKLGSIAATVLTGTCQFEKPISLF